MKNRFYKILSIILSAAMIFSVCTVVASAVETTGNNYYVLNGADDANDGKTPNTPVPTVADAIAKINADGLDADDTANVYIMQRADWATPVAANSAWNLTVWAATGTRPDEHTARIIVQPYGTNTDAWGNTYLAFGELVAKQQKLDIAGPTTFKNLMLVCPRWDYDPISLNGHDVTFGEGVKYMRLNNASSGWKGEFPDNESTGYPGIYTTMGDNSKDGTYTNPVNIVFEHVWSAGATKNRIFYISSSGPATHTFKEDVNITVNNSKFGTYFQWGNYNAGKTTFEKNLNFNIISSGTITNSNVVDKATGEQAVNVGGGIQILLHSASAWAGDVSSFENVVAKGGIFKLVNNTPVSDIISFTETAGVYAVKEGYSVAAYDADGKEYPCANGYLKVPAGEYTIREYTAPETSDYYVLNGAADTNDGKTPNTPVSSVAAAIAKINADELDENDTANIWIMQREDWNYKTVDNGDGSTSTVTANNITYWVKDGETADTHKARIVVQAYDSTKTTYLTFRNSFPTDSANQYVTFTGPTTTKNIVLVSPRIYYFQMYANGKNLTFGEGTKWGDNQNWKTDAEKGVIRTIPAIGLISAVAGKNDSCSEAQNIVIESDYDSGNGYERAIFIGNRGGYTYTYNADITVTIDNASATPSLYWGCYSSSGKSIFNGNVNVNVKSAEAVNNIDGWGTTTLNGAVQIINSGAPWNGDVTTFVDTSKGYYYLNNVSGNNELISFTSTAGKFKVNSELQVIAVDGNGVSHYSKDGYLDLREAGSGVYTVKTGGKNKFENYINYRTDLKNTYAKLTSGDKNLNVVYFGGSVTKGTGVSDADALSWRGLVGSWLKTTFPEANINNINRACGESGTYLGAYRFERDVIGANPDLLFLEYSINDYYYGSNKTKAASQFETIVRKVREQLPNCDIVTVLVTNESLANGTLHTQAQAHEEISAAYNIPTIHVGRALADALPAGWTAADWDVYMGDGVHPNEAGYKFYFDVIEEFMYNSLVVANYDGTITAHAMPEMQSDTLFDGKVTVITPTEELLARSEELGGSGFVYNPKVYGPIDNYTGTFNNSGSEDPELVVEFTGTELVMLANTGISNFYVSVDGGEYELKSVNSHNPSVVTSGLRSAKHTVKIKPVLGGESIIIVALYSRDEAYQTAKAAFINYGDVDADETIGVLDLVRMKKLVAEQGTYCPPADIYVDGKIDSTDLTKLRKHILGAELINNSGLTDEEIALRKIQKIARIGYRVYDSSTPPEQSLASFEMAYEQGYEILLCDIRLTADGELVCLHDATINSVARNSDGTQLSEDIYISEITLAEADNYDFGIKKGNQYKGTKILRLAEFLELCQRLGCTPHLEIKVTPELSKCDEIISLVKQYGFENNVMFNSSYEEGMRYIAEKLPSAVMGRWVQNITDNMINTIASYGDTNKKFIYVSNGYEASITEENYLKCLEKGIDIGYTEIRNEEELAAAKEAGFLKYCKYVATRIFDLTD